MCGICGYYKNKNKIADADIERVQRMNHAMIHRGPDEEGLRVFEQGVIAMRRLAIIDLSGGKQPISNEDETLFIVFNGEIYNYKALRKSLLDKGHRFKTKSDTEVILHLYEEYGEDAPKYLKGMFAFCIYDTKNNSLFLARDRFGEKPLFYHLLDGNFTFSSEIKSLLENKNIERKLDQSQLYYYLVYGYVPHPNTLLKNVKNLLPGYFLKIQNGKLISKPYFEITYPIDEQLRDENAAVEYISPILEEAVKSQMESEVPLGAFLSGGIDSSTVVAFLQQYASQPIKTFTVKFEEASYDESYIAREVAQYLGTDHHEILIPNTNFSEDIFWKIIAHVGNPFIDTSAIPTYFITQEIRKQVTVALSGDGGDELFGGYKEFLWQRKVNKLQRFPLFARKLALATGDSLSSVISGSSKLRQVNRALHLSQFEGTELPKEYYTWFNQKQFQEIAESVDIPRKNVYENYPSEASEWSMLRKQMYYRQVHKLPLRMLTKVDRMSMANSLEVRAPFLDKDLFEASTKLPDRFLVKGDLGKYIIRKAMKDYLPKSVFEHPKTGFGIPLYKYQNEAYEQLANRLLTNKNPLSELINLNYIEKIKNTSLNIRKDTSDLSVYRSAHQLWMMMQLFGWMEYFRISI